MDIENTEQSGVDGGVQAEASETENSLPEFPADLLGDASENQEPEKEAKEEKPDTEKTEENGEEKKEEEKPVITEEEVQAQIKVATQEALRKQQAQKDREIKPLNDKISEQTTQLENLQTQLTSLQSEAGFQVLLEQQRAKWEDDGASLSKITSFQDTLKEHFRWYNQAQVSFNQLQRHIKDVESREKTIAQRELQLDIRDKIASKYGVDPTVLSESKSLDEAELKALRHLREKPANTVKPPKAPQKIDSGVSTGTVSSDEQFLKDYASGKTHDHARARKLQGF